MIYNKILLIFPDYRGGMFGALRPPAGLGYLSGMLEKEGIEYDVLDMLAGGTLKTLKNKLRNFKPDLVGVSLMSVMYKESYNLINYIKNIYPKAYIVAGGPHTAVFREAVLMHCQNIDFCVVGEGEKAIVELCKGTPLEDIKGLVYRPAEKKIFYTGDREFETNLDSLPYPRYAKFKLDNYLTGEIGIVTSRGCPYNCIFCSAKNDFGSKFRTRNTANIMEEIEYWYSCGYRDISILDSNFALIKERVIELCDTIIKNNFKGMEFNCRTTSLRADTVDKEVLQKMKDAGFRSVSFGVESGNEKILKIIRKGESIEEIRKTIECAIELDLEVSLTFIIGSPQETLEDFKESLDFAKRYTIFDAKFYHLVPSPNTELFNFVKENKYFTVSPENYLNYKRYLRPVFATPYFTQRERLIASKMASSVRKGIRYTWAKRRLEKKIGIFSVFLARIYVSDYVLRILMRSRIRKHVKKVLGYIKNKLFR